jgi:hypothetical protein
LLRPLFGERGAAFLWPTMLAIVSERFSLGGALAIGLMRFTSVMAIQSVLPKMGAIFDTVKATVADRADNLATLSPIAMTEVVRYASVESFQSVAITPIVRILPILVLPVFGLIWLYDVKKWS